MYIYTYIYILICIHTLPLSLSLSLSHTHTHTHKLKEADDYICMYVCKGSNIGRKKCFFECVCVKYIHINIP